MYHHRHDVLYVETASDNQHIIGFKLLVYNSLWIFIEESPLYMYVSPRVNRCSKLLKEISNEQQLLFFFSVCNMRMWARVGLLQIFCKSLRLRLYCKNVVSYNYRYFGTLIQLQEMKEIVYCACCGTAPELKFRLHHWTSQDMFVRLRTIVYNCSLTMGSHDIFTIVLQFSSIRTAASVLFL